MVKGSPWITVEDIDKSIIEVVPTQVDQGQFFIIQEKGPVNVPILIRSQGEFVNIFGTQNPDDTHLSTYVQYNFLTQFPQYIMRVQKNQKYQGQTISLSQTEPSQQVQFDENTQPERLDILDLDENINFQILQKYPGDWGNKISIHLEPTKLGDSTEYNQFQLEVKYDGETVELFTFTENPNVVDELGNSLYMGEVLKNSQYITVVDNPTKMFDFSQFVSEEKEGSETFTTTTDTQYTLTTQYDVVEIIRVTMNGVELQRDVDYSVSPDNKTITLQSQPTQGNTLVIEYRYVVPPSQDNLTIDITLGGGHDEPIDENNPDDVNIVVEQLEEFKDDDRYNFNYIFNQGWTNLNIIKQVIGVQEQRRDCVQIIDPPNVKNVDQVVQWRQGQGFDTSVQQTFFPWLIVKNSFNNRLIEVPPSFFVGKMLMNIDLNLGQHMQVQGFQRGRISQIGVTVKLRKQDRDVLYDNQINPIQYMVNQGIFIWGNKTLYLKTSKLNRLTSRRIVSLQVIKYLKDRLKGYLFRPYNTQTLSDLNSFLSSFVDRLKRQGMVEDMRFRIVQTPELRNENKIQIEIDLIPVGQVEYIHLVVSTYPSGGFTVTEQ